MLDENTILQKLTRKFPKPAYQVNTFLESDAELIRIPGIGHFAITTDCIVEEIASGLYKDPFFIGWMTVVASLSDLAAVGARPLGLVLSQSFPGGLPWEYIDRIQDGIQAACAEHGTYVLGGDTNECPVIQMGATALGRIVKPPVISRKGAAPGHHVYITGKMGAGNAFAFDTFLSGRKPHDYLPIARITEGDLIRKQASACIDTSDGFVPAVCNLMEINRIGLTLSIPVESMLDPVSLELGKSHRLPSWIFLSGPHGEYELLFTVHPDHVLDFESAARTNKIAFTRIGTCSEAAHLEFVSNGKKYTVNPFEIANAFQDCGKEPRAYLSSLLEKNLSWKKEPHKDTPLKTGQTV